VVLAWLIGGEVPVIPLVGASSVAQLDESLAAVDLELTAAQRARLDAAGSLSAQKKRKIARHVHQQGGSPDPSDGT
jgi:aryl-alcohol dehydrogenase-like predicted oxidoreductase